MRKFFVLFLLFAALLVLLDACSTQKQTVKEKVSPVAIAPLQPGVLFDYPQPRLASGLPVRRLAQTERMPLYYHQAYATLEAMLEGREMPDFEKAVFVSENAYYDNHFTLEGFRYTIDQHQFFVQALAAANDKSDSMDFNVKVNQYGRFNLGDIRFLPEEKKELYKKAVANWAIFTYITDTTAIAPFYHLPFTYATQDPFGIKEWANSQVIHLLGSGEQKGNCFALTALFKILSDRLGSESRLCTAPQHIYIQHRDNKGDYYNVELATAGHPGDGTIQTLTHTTTEAIRSGIALRSYDAKQGVGLCLVNLAKSYEHKFQTKGDAFMLKCAELALKHDSLNLNALLLKQQILDTWVTAFAKTKHINDIDRLKTDRESCNAVIALEQHLALLYRLGYREMPLDMQEIIMTGVYPENFEDKTPSPFTSIDPKDPHRKKFQTLYGGLFQEVFETRKYEPYGHFTLKTTHNKISGMDTTAKTVFLIDPVAFAYDFGARIYDARLGRWLSTDPLQAKYPGFSPYNFVANNPVIFVDADGRDNIIYLVYLPGPNNKLTLADAKKIRDEANKNFERLGLKTRVVLVDKEITKGKDFDPSKIDKTDAVAVLGAKTDVVNYVQKHDPQWAKVVKAEWDGGAAEPEKGENEKGNGFKDNAGGNFIVLDAIGILANEAGVKGADEKDGAIKFGGYLINHAAGHNAGLNHDDYSPTSNTTSVIMSPGNDLRGYLADPTSSYPTIESVTNNDPVPFDKTRKRNADYVEAAKKRFGVSAAKVNYKP